MVVVRYAVRDGPVEKDGEILIPLEKEGEVATIKLEGQLSSHAVVKKLVLGLLMLGKGQLHRNKSVFTRHQVDWDDQ